MVSNVLVVLGCAVLVVAVGFLTADVGFTLLALAVVLLLLGYLSWRFPAPAPRRLRRGEQ